MGLGDTNLAPMAHARSEVRQVRDPRRGGKLDVDSADA